MNIVLNIKPINLIGIFLNRLDKLLDDDEIVDSFLVKNLAIHSGGYTKQFIQALEALPIQYLFKSWKAPASVLESCGIVLGETYLHSIVDLETSKKKALHAYQHIVS